MDMRERIARAINPTAFALSVEGHHPGDLADYQAFHRPIALRQADAVLDAMMEPDEGMILAGMDVDDDATFDPPHSGLRSEGPKIIWQAMITAARSGA